MRLDKWNLFSVFYQSFCIILCIGLAVFWTYKFTLNEDLAKVEYKEFLKDIEDVYPTMTLCFRNPFVTAQGDYMNELDRFQFEQMFSGKISMPSDYIDYDNMTFQLSDFVSSYYIRWKNGSIVTYPPSQYTWNHVHETFSGFWRGEFYKCFSVEIPNNKVALISVLIDNKVFPNGTRPFYFDFFVMFHYPKQMLRPSLNYNHRWPIKRDKGGPSYDMTFVLQNIEVLRRRKNCDKNWKEYDTALSSVFINTIGCKPPFYTHKHDSPLCNTSEEMKKFASNIYLENSNGMEAPCKSMENINIEYEELTFSGSEWNSNGNFWCSMTIPNVFFKV